MTVKTLIAKLYKLNPSAHVYLDKEYVFGPDGLDEVSIVEHLIKPTVEFVVLTARPRRRVTR